MVDVNVSAVSTENLGEEEAGERQLNQHVLKQGLQCNNYGHIIRRVIVRMLCSQERVTSRKVMIIIVKHSNSGPCKKHQHLLYDQRLKSIF